MNTKPLLNSVSQTTEWLTPKPFFHWLSGMYGPFTLDPCTDLSNWLGTPAFYTRETDGLRHNWERHRVYVNPPYGRKVTPWIQKGVNSMFNSPFTTCVVMLLPARTGNPWFHDLVLKYAAQIMWIRGRLKFVGAPHMAPFDSMVVVFDARVGTAGKPAHSSWRLSPEERGLFPNRGKQTTSKNP